MKVLIVAVVLAIGACFAVPAMSNYLLKLNQQKSVNIVDIKPPPPDRSPPSLTIEIVDGPRYLVDGQAYDLSALKHLLADKRASIQSVAIQVSTDKGFGLTVEVLDEVRRLGIEKFTIDSQHPPPKP